MALAPYVSEIISWWVGGVPPFWGTDP